MKATKIPYKGVYTTRNVVSIDKLKEIGQEIGDGCEFIDNLETDIDNDLALTRLPKRQRQVVEMERDGYSPTEIARKMGISIGTVYLQKAKAKNKIKRYIK